MAAPPLQDSVGVQLRRAREASGMTLDEVANILKFSPRQIEALEADRYGALPGATIVRGFVRSYARLFKLDADALLRQLEPVMPSQRADIRPPDNMGVASQARGVRQFSPLATIALVLLLAAAMLALWHLFGPTATRSATTTVVTGQAADSVAVPLGPVTAGVAVAPAENVMPPQAAQATDSATPTLRFVFAERAWLEVTDANKRLLHSGESPGGSQLTLTGKPPFNIVIGNASKVTLTYRDKFIDLSPHMRAEVARLTLE